jgi:hypothetical protein
MDLAPMKRLSCERRRDMHNLKINLSCINHNNLHAAAKPSQSTGMVMAYACQGKLLEHVENQIVVSLVLAYHGIGKISCKSTEHHVSFCAIPLRVKAWSKSADHHISFGAMQLWVKAWNSAAALKEVSSHVIRKDLAG